MHLLAVICMFKILSMSQNCKL